MLSWISSFGDRAKSFLSRNKGKLIGSAVLVGGVWYYYRDTISQAWQMYQLIQQVNSASVEDADVHEDDAAFTQTVLTGDETSQKYFQQIRVQRADLYAEEMDRIQLSLKSKSGDQSERERAFAEFNFLVFSRFILSLVVVDLLLLLGRVQVCLIGKANKHPVTEETKIDHRELLSALRNLSQKDSMAELDSVVRECVRTVFYKQRISPASVVSRDSLVEILSEIASLVIEKSNLIQSSAAAFAWLLGRLSLDPESEQSSICKETLDILESPQFSAVLVMSAQKSIAEGLKRSIPKSVGTTFPLAVLIASVRAEAESVTTVGGPHVILFQSLPVVEEFCRAIYTSEVDSDDLAMYEQLAEGAGIDENDPHMAKLGELLEKLVKADTSS
jgi:hypothetical protein